ncbi:hypothetical protein [Streptomyces cellulosae]|uniref:Short-chain dehydrogenase n=1 Tax=Streptomyces cellulosae TaxID=1968 RepID=A0ABW7YGG7_STRCE
MKITGNTILITGGTSDIGRSPALRRHEAGNEAVAAGRRKELLDAITAEHPGIDAPERTPGADPDQAVLRSHSR